MLAESPREEDLFVKSCFLACTNCACFDEPYTSHPPDGILGSLWGLRSLLKHNRRLENARLSKLWLFVVLCPRSTSILRLLPWRCRVFFTKQDAEEIRNDAVIFFFLFFSCILCSFSMYSFAFPVSKIYTLTYAVDRLLLLCLLTLSLHGQVRYVFPQLKSWTF